MTFSIFVTIRTRKRLALTALLKTKSMHDNLIKSGNVSDKYNRVQWQASYRAPNSLATLPAHMYVYAMLTSQSLIMELKV